MTSRELGESSDSKGEGDEDSDPEESSDEEVANTC